MKPGKIAELLGCSKNTVLKDLDALGLEREGKGRQARKLTGAQIARRRKRAKELYEAGNSLREIATANDSSPTQVRRDLGVLGVAIRPERRYPRYPPPSERACAHCGDVFTPSFPSGGDRRYCQDACARAARANAGNAALEGRGLLGTGQVAGRLGIGEHQVGIYIKDYGLGSEQVRYAGAMRPIHGIPADEAHRFEREWANNGGGRRRAASDPAYVLAKAERDGQIARLVETGLTHEQARTVIRDKAEQRRRRLARRRAGRKPGNGPPDYHRRWQARAEEIQREMARDVELGLLAPEDAGPGRVEAAVAEWAWQNRVGPLRDDYPSSPTDPEALDPNYARVATDRVRKALKRLQGTRTRITAA